MFKTLSCTVFKKTNHLYSVASGVISQVDCIHSLPLQCPCKCCSIETNYQLLNSVIGIAVMFTIVELGPNHGGKAMAISFWEGKNNFI